MTDKMLSEPINVLWAKTDPYHPLWCHLLDTAAVCDQLIAFLGRPDDLPAIWTMYIAALHDIGKADPEFQVLNDDQSAILLNLGLPLPSHKGEFRHEARSGRWAYGYLMGEKRKWGKYATRLAAAALRGHHGNFDPRHCGCDSIGYDVWEQIRAQIAEMVEDVLGVDDEPAPTEFANASFTGIKLIGLIVLSDWIASNEELFRYPEMDRAASPHDYWSRAQSEAVHAVGVLQLGRFDERPDEMSIPAFRDVWPDITDLRPSQHALEEACLAGLPPGLAIIEAPMGEGKTESAVHLAECWRLQSGASGAYIALPTMSTSNQMHERYSKFLSKYRPDGAAPRLVHGMAWLIDDVTPNDGSITFGEDRDEEWLLAREWFGPSKRALIAPEGVGTIDQVLMAALNVKHGFLRLLGLSSKVLIIDEVHAYDEYMTTILERMLEWCRTLRIPVIMLSATLSKPQKKRLIEAYSGSLDDLTEHYPLITVIPMDGSETRQLAVAAQATRTVYVVQHTGMLDDAPGAAKLATSLVENGGCACVLMNTVKQAQTVFKELDKLDPSGEHYLFHARFPARRRSEIEKQVVGLFGKEAIKKEKRPPKAVLVASQVAEQSLDLDFDVMISQLAPIDLLLQRCGRLWRHKETPRPNGMEEALHILMPDCERPVFGASEYVYGEHVLLRTRDMLRDRSQFDLPDDFRPLIDACYGDGSVTREIASEREERARMEWERKRELDANKACVGLIPEPSARVFSLAEATDARNESDEATDSYFSLSTRLGGTTRSVLILEDSDLIEAARRAKAPHRDVLKMLFMHKVDVPGWWIEDVVATDGFDRLEFEVPKWLRRTIVIPMKSGRWRGMRDGKPFDITCDDVMGVEIDKDTPEWT